MTLEQLRERVAGGESEVVEFKTSTGQIREAMQTLCGMANGVGGFVVFGVRPNGEIVGQEVSDTTLQKVAAEIQCIDPPLVLTIHDVPLDAPRSVLVVSIERAEGPYTYRHVPYIRIASTTREMQRDVYTTLLLERAHAQQRWERLPARLGVDALDASEITRTVDEAIRRGRLEEPGTRDTMAVLRSLGVAEGDVILNAGVVLFSRADRLLPDYPQCLLRMARFGRTADEFIDNRQAHGNAFDLLLRAERFLRDHLPVAGRIVPNLIEREDDPLYPVAALREVLANALCHRDYSIGGGSVSVALRPDRLEIKSTGILHFGLTVEDLLRDHASRPWNPLIAGVFYRRGLIDQWGSGTLRMMRLASEVGQPPPVFEERGGEVVVRFMLSAALIVAENSQRSSQDQVLILLRIEGPLTPREIVRRLNLSISARTLSRILAKLKQKGLLEKSGRGPSSTWWAIPSSSR